MQLELKRVHLSLNRTPPDRRDRSVLLIKQVRTLLLKTVELLRVGKVHESFHDLVSVSSHVSLRSHLLVKRWFGGKIEAEFGYGTGVTRELGLLFVRFHKLVKSLNFCLFRNFSVDNLHLGFGLFGF